MGVPGPGGVLRCCLGYNTGYCSGGGGGEGRLQGMLPQVCRGVLHAEVAGGVYGVCRGCEGVLQGLMHEGACSCGSCRGFAWGCSIGCCRGC